MSDPMPPQSNPLRLTLIVAATNQTLGIGKNGGLPWRLKAEMQYFARVTTRLPAGYTAGEAQNAVIMGRKTWESIPKKFRPLKDRVNVVLTRNAGAEEKEGAIWCKSLEDAVERLQSGKVEDVSIARAFIIGGAGVYKTALDMPNKIADRILLTKVYENFDCDTFFPVDLDGAQGGESGWKRRDNAQLSEWVGEEIEEGTIKEGTTEFEYCMYERV